MSLESGLSKFGKCLDSLGSSLSGGLKSLVLSIRSRGKSGKNVHPISSSYLVLVLDSFVAFLSIFVSIHLRIGMDFLDYSPSYILKNMLVFGLVSSSVFVWMHTHQSFWRYTSIRDMPPVLLSVLFSNLVFFPLMILMNQEDFLPYSVLTINIFVLTLLLLLPRFLSRMLYDRKLEKVKMLGSLLNSSKTETEVAKVLLVGSNASVEIFLREIVLNEEISYNFEPVGILTLDQLDIGHIIRGVPILGELRDIHSVLKELHKDGSLPRQIVITEKAIPENAKKFLIKYANDRKLLLMQIVHQCTFNAVA